MIPWETVKHFSKNGDVWSEDPDKYMDLDLMNALDLYRTILGKPVYPSPVDGALARFSGSRTSRHYVGDENASKRLSDALDVFPDANIQKAFINAVQSRLFGGIGVYFDTQYRGRDWPMLHLDLRPKNTTTLWFRTNKTDYHYPSNNEEAMTLFMRLLNEHN